MRLLTVVRRANSSEQHYVCLAIVLSAKDRSLIVSTKEELLQNYGKSGVMSSANADSIIGMQQQVHFKTNIQRNCVCWNFPLLLHQLLLGFGNGKMQIVAINLWSFYNFQRRSISVYKEKLLAKLQVLCIQGRDYIIDFERFCL